MKRRDAIKLAAVLGISPSMLMVDEKPTAAASPKKLHTVDVLKKCGGVTFDYKSHETLALVIEDITRSEINNHCDNVKPILESINSLPDDYHIDTIHSAIDCCIQYMRDARFDVVKRMIDVFSLSFIIKIKQYIDPVYLVNNVRVFSDPILYKRKRVGFYGSVNVVVTNNIKEAPEEISFLQTKDRKHET